MSLPNYYQEFDTSTHSTLSVLLVVGYIVQYGGINAQAGTGG